MFNKLKKIFNFFNITDEEIPLFLKDFQITYADIQNEKSFLEKIDEKLLDFIARELKINRDWLYGNSEYMIKEEVGFYKRYNLFCDEILSKYPTKLHIITQRQPNKETDEKKSDNNIEIVAEYTLTLSNNKTIFRYETFQSGCRWGYWRCRWEIKKLLLSLKKHHFINQIVGHVCPEEFSEKFVKFKQGELAFNDFINSAYGYGWYPEDYIEFKTSNAEAKEEEELADILKELDLKDKKTIDKIDHLTIDKTSFFKEETNDYVLYENEKNDFKLEELAKELSKQLQTKFILLLLYTEHKYIIYTDNEYILQLLRFDFSNISSGLLVFNKLIFEQINISYDFLIEEKEDNFTLIEYNFAVQWYYLYKIIADSLFYYSKNILRPLIDESYGEKLYQQLSNSGIFKENNLWIVDFENLKTIDPLHIFVSFNSDNQKEETRKKRILVLLKIFEKEFHFIDSGINLGKIIDNIEKLGIDFNGCPTPKDINILSQRNKKDQNILWDMFFNLINYKEINFQTIETVYDINIISFTLFMFWIRPLQYISLDKNIFPLLENNNKITELPRSYNEYENLLTKKSHLIYISLSKIGCSDENQVNLSIYEKKELDDYFRMDNENLQELKLEKNEFEIIAIKVLKNSDEKYTKNLIENHYYQLNNTYEINNNKIFKKEFLKNIYSTNNNINICAIVGKNGTGKSTLAEVLFGFIYNLSIKQNVTKEMSENTYITLNLELIFKHDAIYRIISKGSRLEVMRYDENDEIWNVSNEFNLNQFFYTIGINYSIYANNKKFMGDWIEKIFHKNDAYQTPIVLEPFREDGNIDINKQSTLAKQRLVVNLLKPIDENKDYSLRKLRYSDDYSIAEKLRLTFNYLKIVQEEYSAISEQNIYKNNNIIVKYNEIEKANNIINQLYSRFEISQDIEFNFEKSIKEHSFFGKVQLYILKKIVTIVNRYEKYAEYKEFENIEKLIIALDSDNSHITYKLKRGIYFLKYNLLEKKENFEINVHQLSKDIDIFLSNNKEKSFHQLTPPSFYEIEILLGADRKKTNTKKEFISFDTLSSGEKQRILFINALIYHLENINSSIEQEYKYRYVNIILDEIELYYHPEYQRQHLHFLLHNLNKVDISNIFGINIIFITHSPFILTDIINQNVLFLDNHSTIKTFGANMFDLFQDGFFVENSIGSFSEEYIKAISLILSYFQAIRLENIFLLRRLINKWYSISNESPTEEKMKEEDEQLFANIRLNKLKYLKDIFENNNILYRKYSYLIDEKNSFIIDKLNKYIELIGDEVLKKHLLNMYSGLL